MSKPDPILISLTPEQAELLKAHFAHVTSEANRGAKGMLVGQIWNVGNPYDADHPMMRVGFLENEKAKQFQGAANP
jgi:hypothetical protein